MSNPRRDRIWRDTIPVESMQRLMIAIRNDAPNLYAEFADWLR